MAGVFNDMALSIAGSRRGDPAKVSVLASGLMGSVSGSASANVVTTGSFTIPLMRKMGYRDYFASAVEAAASTGGQIMPPVMGAAAFLIADSLGIPFLTVIRAAFLPAVLYYYSIWHMVDLRARKENIQGLSKDELPNLKELLIKRGHLLIPLVGIIYMLVSGYNAITAAVMGIVLSIVSSFLKRDTWIKPIELINAMQAGALSALPVATACAVIGILVGIISLTGAILAASAAVLKMSGGILFVTLIMTMLTATMLGNGNAHHGLLHYYKHSGGAKYNSAWGAGPGSPPVCFLLWNSFQPSRRRLQVQPIRQPGFRGRPQQGWVSRQ